MEAKTREQLIRVFLLMGLAEDGCWLLFSGLVVVGGPDRFALVALGLAMAGLFLCVVAYRSRQRDRMLAAMTALGAVMFAVAVQVMGGLLGWAAWGEIAFNLLSSAVLLGRLVVAYWLATTPAPHPSPGVWLRIG